MWGPLPRHCTICNEAVSRLCAWNIRCNNNAPMTLSKRLVTLLLALTACRDATGTEKKPAPAQTAEARGSGSATLPRPADKPPEPDETYVPAEHKSGMSRWKDVGVYLDGKPISFMTFGELPISLQPTWVTDEVSVNKPPGCPECPDRKTSRMRYYKFTDYLKALGVDVKKVKVMHVYGPKLTDSIVVTGKDLQSKAAEHFMFRFGGLASGKAIPSTPDGFGNDRAPDKISGVMIYIDRKPPTVTREAIELDGVEQMGVPYYGEPLRGGVRIYADDKLATVIKRQDLDPKQATQTPDGELHWSLAAFLKSRGVDTSHLVEGWVIRGERRAEKLTWAELEKMTFTASSQAKGTVTLGDGKVVVGALALHSRPIKDEELPKVLDEEQW